jgi:hypothetical protein
MSAGLETCANCGRTIGKLETPHVHNEHVVCAECHGRLGGAMHAPGAQGAPVAAVQREAGEYRALGLNSRGAAWGIAIVGLLLSPLIIGIPLLVWGAVADSMIVKHQKAADRKAGSVATAGVILGTVFVGAVIIAAVTFYRASERERIDNANEARKKEYDKEADDLRSHVMELLRIREWEERRARGAGK